MKFGTSIPGWLFVLVLGLAAVGFGGGCQAPANPDQPTRPQVALVMKSLANEFFSTMAEGAQAHQAEHADEYDLIVDGIKDERDLSRQVALVREMIAKRVDAIVIAPADSKALVPVLRDAREQGIVVINIDNKLDDAVLDELGLEIPFVGPNNRSGARQVGAYLAKQLAPGDPVVILEGLRTSFNGRERLAGFQEAMSEANLEIVDSQSAQWEMNLGNQVATAMLSEHPELKAILACNDSMALGALSAVKAQDRDDVLIVGFDNIQAVQEAIERGEILATADQHGDQLAVYGIEQALSQLRGEPASEDRETPVDLITAESLSQH